MLTKSYHKYIKSPIWKAKCELYWMKKGRWCRACGSKNHLVVHHLSYEHFGREPLADLVGLCHTDHLEVHRLHRLSGRKTDIRTITINYIRAKRKRL